LGSLNRKAVNSVRWTTLQTVVAGVTGPLYIAIKARYLSPEDFAYVAIIFIITGFCHTLEGFGFSQGIIQKDSISVEESSSLFLFNVSISCILVAVVNISSPVLAKIFTLPKLNYYLPYTSIIILLTGPSLIFRGFLEKELLFKQLSLIDITRNLIMVSSSTLLLVFGFGVTGIIWGQILSVLFTSVAIIIVNFRFGSAKIKLYFSLTALKPFLRFGIFVSGKQIMTFLTHRLDELVIGYFLAPEILGTYHFGKNMLEKIRALMTMSFSKVLFPILSKFKHNQIKLSHAYKKISSYIAFGAFPVFSGIAVTANLFVPLIFGEQWIESIIVFQVFSISVILLVLTANISTSLLYSVNKPGLVFCIDIVTNLTYFVSLLIFAKKGMLAILIAYSCYVTYKTLLLQYFANRQLENSFKHYFINLLTPALSAIIMVVSVLAFQTAFKQILDKRSLLIGSILIGVLVFIILVRLFAYETAIEIKSALIKGELTH
jgi:O-antigen/teichoic acid export membrane protein